MLPRIFIIPLPVLALAVLNPLSHRPALANHPVNPDSHPQVILGKTVYQENCVACHGTNLKGPENPADFEGKTPPRLDAAGHATHHGDQFFFDQIKRGSRLKNGARDEKGMPAFEEILTDSQIWAAIAYIKSTWSAAARRAQDKMNPGHSGPNGSHGGHGGGANMPSHGAGSHGGHN